MILFLDGHDLRFVTLGIIQHDVFLVVETLSAPPEKYLACLQSFCIRHNIQLKELQGVSLVTGPGSFTSSRVSLTIANTLHFVHDLPLFTIENPSQLSPQDLLKDYGIGTPLQNDSYARPCYGRSPHITSPVSGDKSLED